MARRHFPETIRTLRRGAIPLVAALGVIGASWAAGSVPVPRAKPLAPRGAVERPIGLRPYFAAPAPAEPDSITDQQARGYRSQIDRELRDLELRGGPADRRDFDRMQQLRQERSRMDNVIRSYRR